MLIGNGRLINKLPMTFLGRDWNAQIMPGALPATTSTENFGAKAAMPDGYYTPQCWMLPRKAGAMSARNMLVMSITTGAAAAAGLPGSASASFTIDFATATGGLISSGIGSASFAITTTATVLATRSGDGTASFSITTNTPLLGALGWVTASGAFSVSATLASYARGYMTGTTVDASSIVNANIVSVNGYSVTGNGQPGTEWGPA